MSIEMAGNSKAPGYEDPRTEAVPTHAAPSQAAPPQAGGKQLTTDQPWNTGGLAGPIVKNIAGRVGSMIKGATEGRGPGSGMPGGLP